MKLVKIGFQQYEVYSADGTLLGKVGTLTRFASTRGRDAWCSFLPGQTQGLPYGHFTRRDAVQALIDAQPKAVTPVSADFLDGALDGALDILNNHAEGTYAVVAADDSDGGRIIPALRPHASKTTAAARQTRLMNEGYRAYLAVRFEGTDYLMGYFDGATMIYLSRPAPQAVVA